MVGNDNVLKTDEMWKPILDLVNEGEELLEAEDKYETICAIIGWYNRMGFKVHETIFNYTCTSSYGMQLVKPDVRERIIAGLNEQSKLSQQLVDKCKKIKDLMEQQKALEKSFSSLEINDTKME